MSEPDKKQRDEVLKIAAPAFALLSKDKAAHLEEIRASYPYIRLCLKIAKEVETYLNKWMEETLHYTFAGIACLAYRILSIPDIAKKIKERYKFVMVDEYQDTSDLQENLLTLLSDNNLFAVGDIKQSIYRFRNANPAIFADRLERYSAGKEGQIPICRSLFSFIIL